MKHFYLSLITLFLVALTTACGGGDDDNTDTGGGGQTTSAPKVVSVSPVNGATDIATGEVTVTLTYDQAIRLTSTSRSSIQISGGTVESIGISNALLKIIVSCPTYNTTVALTIPKGLVTNVSQQQAEAYSLSFTTVKETEPVSPSIPATPQTASTDAAKKLYSYFVEQYGQKTISSVMANVNWNNECAEKVYKLTGKYPAMNCYDFIHVCFSPANWIDYTNIAPVEQWYQAGGIVQLMWHFNVPKTQGGTDYTCTPSETTFKASNALVSGTWENQWFYGQMDKVVATILKLQQAGIAATWRPFHEAAGNATLKSGASWGKSWFWWGYDGADTYKKLWVTMYDYFKQKGINNLIWVWTTQNYNGDSSQYNLDADWYPGDQYVDIVARDLYGYNADKNLQEFTEIQAQYPNKMVVLGECGKGDDGDPSKMGDAWAKGAKWGHFMVWYQGGQGSTDTMCSDAWWKDAMSCTDVITRDQVK